MQSNNLKPKRSRSEAAKVTAWGSITDRVLISLKEEGPGTSSQIAARLGVSQNSAANALHRLCKPIIRGGSTGVTGVRRAHIHGWFRGEVVGLRFYLRPIYAAGSGRDADKPARLTNAQRNKRRRKNSVASADVLEAMIPKTVLGVR